MSVKFLSLAWDVPLEAVPKLVLLSLCDQANDDGLCWPGVESISRRTALGRSTIYRVLDHLQDLGIVERHTSGARRDIQISADRIRDLIEKKDLPLFSPAAGQVSPGAGQTSGRESRSGTGESRSGTNESRSGTGLSRSGTSPNTRTVNEPSLNRQGTVDCAEASLAQSAGDLILIPVVGGKGKGPREIPIAPELIAELSAAFPSIDVRAELLKMRAYVVLHPAKRKTESGLGRACFAWLSKANDFGGSRAPVRRESVAEANRRALAELTAGA